LGDGRRKSLRLAREPVGLFGDDVLAFLLERLGPDVALVRHAAPLLVRTLAPPGEQRVVAEAVEPRADQRITAAELVVEEGEGQPPVERLDPERHARELDGQRILIYAVEAVL